MVRTAAGAIKVVGGKSSRKEVQSAKPSTRSRSPSSGSVDRGTGGLNSVCPRETPSWQKPITSFFKCTEQTKGLEQNDDTSQNRTDDVTMESEDMQGPKQINESTECCSKNKENRISNEDHNIEMNKINGSIKKNVNMREDSDEDEIAAPKKRLKLDDVNMKMQEA